MTSKDHPDRDTLRRIPFRANYNNKLHARALTTIRLPGSKPFAPGDTVGLWLVQGGGEDFMGAAVVHEVEAIGWEGLTDRDALTDIGYPLAELHRLLRVTYGDRVGPGVQLQRLWLVKLDGADLPDAGQVIDFRGGRNG